MIGTERCEWVARRLPLVAGGELIGPERRRVERHLLGCESCRGRLAAQERSLEVLRAAAEVEPRSVVGGSASLWPEVRRQIEESRRAGRTFGVWRIPGRRWGMAAAALVLTVLAGVLVWQIGRHYQLVLGLRPRSSVARRVDPRPVFRAVERGAAERAPVREASAQGDTRRDEGRGRELARTPATAGVSERRRGVGVPTN